MGRPSLTRTPTDPPPPPYTDLPNGVEVEAAGNSRVSIQLDQDIPRPDTISNAHGPETQALPTYVEDPEQLLQLIHAEADIAPRQFVQIQGSHIEECYKNGRTSEERVIDFDVMVDCSDAFVSKEQGPDREVVKHFLSAISFTERAKHAALFRCAARRKCPGDVENVPLVTRETDTSDMLRVWCHIYCAEATQRRWPVSFRFNRNVVNWDTRFIKQTLSDMLRSTNYRGDITVKFPLENPGFTVYSRHWMNVARKNIYIWWACVLLQLWIITWPILLLCEGRYDGVSVVYPYSYPSGRGTSTYTTVSELAWLRVNGQLMVDAALARRQGVVGRRDMEAMELARAAAVRSGNVQALPRSQTGNRFVDTAVEILGGIADINRQNDIANGWGGHQSQQRRAGGFSLNFGGPRVDSS